MIDKQFFEELSQQIAKLIPQAGAVGEDVKKTVSAVMQKGFARLDLLTREEFEAQSAALARAEERIRLLEAEMTRLEALVSGAPADDAPTS
ncbi:MAG: accessory factor UbiK family protein [Gammaproteobacteria bacterium]|nr:accessory factor UbiK family protein [Gammaproteobacteria bacterium]MDP2139488.1 accessory factor UbiK family protein [Gammaproteobacteria bacterium]MDP2348443.1 accessory factor UbiK family protein [Gammaproteobacteria bacterium]